MEQPEKRKTFVVTFSRLVRETVTINIESDSKESLQERLNSSDLFELVDEREDWGADVEWGVEAGTHSIDRELGGKWYDKGESPDLKL